VLGVATEARHRRAIGDKVLRSAACNNKAPSTAWYERLVTTRLLRLLGGKDLAIGTVWELVGIVVGRTGGQSWAVILAAIVLEIVRRF